MAISNSGRQGKRQFIKKSNKRKYWARKHKIASGYSIKDLLQNSKYKTGRM